jgi:hypothetical protein
MKFREIRGSLDLFSWRQFATTLLGPENRKKRCFTAIEVLIVLRSTT